MSNKRSFHDENDDGDCCDDVDLSWTDLLYGHNTTTNGTSSIDSPPSRKKPVISLQQQQQQQQQLLPQHETTCTNDSLPFTSDTPIRILPSHRRRSNNNDDDDNNIINNDTLIATSNATANTTTTTITNFRIPTTSIIQQQQQQQQQQLLPLSSSSLDDYDTDDEPPPVFLDWRSDPTKNFSDWQINVVVVDHNHNNNNSTTINTSHRITDNTSSSLSTTLKRTYHVHRNILVVESEYFQRLFDTVDQSYSESKDSTSTIELVEEGAASFEALLDYMYRPGEPNLTTYNALAMHHFGEYFGMKRLRWLARQFWRNDMNANTIATYYKHAGIFLDDKVMHAVKRKCCSVPFLIEAGSSGLLLDVNDPQLWFFLLKHFNGTCSIPMSAFVTEYCDRHHVDAVTFVQMTAKSILPEIFFDVAQQLVELEKRILGNHVELTCLQIRCIKALANEWKRIDVTSDSFTAFLANQSPKFSAELFKQSMLAARSTSEDGTL